VLHEAVAFGKEQGTPQSPQSVTVRMLRSQPLFRFESQLLKPAVQVGLQAPEVHAVVPFAFEQLTPQAPQAAVVLSCVSQSPPGVQSPQPASQPVITQLPVAQDSPPWAKVQATPQLPQSVKVRMSRSHPLDGLLSQLRQPASQVGTHAPAVHALLPCEFVQALPQLAQLVLVPSGSHVPSLPQSSKPALQPVTVQVPLAQLSVAFGMSQGMPQSPQLVSVRMFRSQPLLGSESQLLKPTLQTGVQPFVVLQLVVPLVFVHTSAQERQWAVFPRVVSQLPFESQSALVGSHIVAVQVPVAHVSPEPEISQTTPQFPQFVSVRVEVSQPFAALPSQASQPAVQV
jgi:hypothetical protein